MGILQPLITKYRFHDRFRIARGAVAVIEVGMCSDGILTPALDGKALKGEVLAKMNGRIGGDIR